MNEALRPEAETCVQFICGLLAQQLDVHGNHKAALSALRQYEQHPDFCLYLSHILARADSAPSVVRQSAGLLLKNTLLRFASASDASLVLSKQALSHIRSEVLSALACDDAGVRSSASACITALVQTFGIAEWPGFTETVAACLLSASQGATQQTTVSRQTLQGVLTTIQRLCEDLPHEVAGRSPAPLDAWLEPILTLLASTCGDLPVRIQSLQIVNALACHAPPFLVDKLPHVLPVIAQMGAGAQQSTPVENFSSSHERAAEVAVARFFVTCLEACPGVLKGRIHEVAVFMLKGTRNEREDDELAMEYCEFWCSVCNLSSRTDATASEATWAVEGKACLTALLPELIPLLVGNLQYGEEDICLQSVSPSPRDAMRDADVNPAPLNVQTSSRQRNVPDTVHAHASRAEMRVDEPFDIDPEDTDADGDGGYDRWTLRKCSAASLDAISALMGDVVLPYLLPAVEAKILQADWIARESAVLALGAVAGGCGAAMRPHLPAVVRVVEGAAKSPESGPLLRSIGVWALSRYARPLAEEAQREEEARTVPTHLAGQTSALPPGPAGMIFDAAQDTVLQCVLDKSPIVQEAACTAVATFAEECGESLGRYRGHFSTILNHFSEGLRHYGRRNLRMLCEAISIFCEKCGDKLWQDGARLESLLKPLIDRSESVQDMDRSELLPLFECLSSVVGGLEPNHLSSVVETLRLFRKGKRVVAAQLKARSTGEGDAYESDDSVVVPSAADAELLRSALDLLGALCEKLGSEARLLLAEGCQSNLRAQCAMVPGSECSTGSATHGYDDFDSAAESSFGRTERIGAEGLTDYSRSRFAIGDDNDVVDLVVKSCHDASHDCRQSAFALVGDLAICAFGVIKPRFAELVQLCVRECTIRKSNGKLASAHNAAWALGELIIRADSASARKLAQSASASMAAVLLFGAIAGAEDRTQHMRDDGDMQARVLFSPGLLENAAVTLGRICAVAPEESVSSARHAMYPWCKVLRSLRASIEKEHAFVGMCAMLNIDPSIGLECFNVFCLAISSWHQPNDNLRQRLGAVLHVYKSHLCACGQWDAYWRGLQMQEPRAAAKLAREYAL